MITGFCAQNKCQFEKKNRSKKNVHFLGYENLKIVINTGLEVELSLKLRFCKNCFEL